MGRWLRVYVPGADWLARRWGEYIEGAGHRRRRLEAEQAAARFEDWLEAQYAAGADLTEAVRAAPLEIKADLLRARRAYTYVGTAEVYLTAFGEIDMKRAFS